MDVLLHIVKTVFDPPHSRHCQLLVQQSVVNHSWPAYNVKGYDSGWFVAIQQLMTPTQSQTEIQTGKLKHTHEDTVPGLQGSNINTQTHIHLHTVVWLQWGIQIKIRKHKLTHSYTEERDNRPTDRNNQSWWSKYIVHWITTPNTG